MKKIICMILAMVLMMTAAAFAETFNADTDITVMSREDGSGTRAILEQELRGYNESLQRFQRRICISSFNIILDLVKQGFGVSFVYNILADSDPELAKFSIRGESVVREFNVVYLKYADMNEKIKLFFKIA